MAHRTNWVGRRLIDAVMLFMLVASMTKLVDMAEFEASVGTWELLPRGAATAVVWTVPLAELLAGGLWLVGAARRLALASVACMLVAYTAAFLAHLIVADQPTCHCLGVLMQFEDQRATAVVFVARNIVLLLCLAAGAALMRGSGAGCRHGPGEASAFGRCGRAGFTLVETALVIVLIGLLVSMLLPALSRAREAAYGLDAIADLRSHGQVLSAYSVDYDDAWPFLTDPEASYTVFRHPRAEAAYMLFFKVTQFWHWPLLGSYLPEDGVDMFFAANDRGDRRSGVVSSYMYASTMYSRPDFWNAATRTGPSQWRPARVSETRFPSKKGAMYNVQLLGQPHSMRVQLGLCDGSAATVPWDSVSRGYPKGEGMWHGSFNTFGVRILHTIDGVRGRDVD